MKKILNKQYLLPISLFVCVIMFITTVIGLIGAINIYIIFIISITATLFFNKYLLIYSSEDKIDSGLIVLFSILSLSTIFIVIFIPPFSGDEIAYSLALPRDYANSNHFFYNDNYGPYSAFPQNYEALTTLTLIIFKSPIAIKIVNFFMVLAIALIINRISIICSESKAVGLIASSLFITSLVIISYTPIAKNDIALGFFQVWSILLIIEFYKRSDFNSLIILSIFIGTSIGVKLNGLIFALIIMSLAFIFIVSSDNYKTIKIKKLFILFSIVALISMPWYLKNYIIFGNPFYPAFNQYFIENNNFSTSYINIFNELFFYDYKNFSWGSGTIYGFLSKFINEFGFIAFVFGTFGLYNLLKSKNKYQLIIGILGVTTLIITLRLLFWEPRYSISLLALLCVSAAILIVKFLDKVNHTKIYYYIFPLILLLGFFNAYKIYGRLQYDFITQEKDIFFEKNIPWGKAINYINAKMPPNAKIAIGSLQPFYYLENRSYFHIHPMTEKGDILSVTTPSDFFDLMQTQEIDYIIVNDWPIIRPDNINTPTINRYNDIIFKKSIAESDKLQLILKIDNISIFKIIKFNKNIK